ncbi:hypothetical protein PR048_010656 [Dryococelus australis]|uniref:Uncharacterized protein n=1 Tax=Dryococelus australis TaxID=614101 RepID=A0ABQ9I3S5_9NEOP|nr:hypothetical protein PR048_010656 [Dryococelus australis]
MRVIEVSMEQRRNERAGGNGRSPRKPADQRASSGTIPTCETPEKRIRLERASQKQSIDTHKTPYDRVKRSREHKKYIKASESAGSPEPDKGTAAPGRGGRERWELVQRIASLATRSVHTHTHVTLAYRGPGLIDRQGEFPPSTARQRAGLSHHRASSCSKRRVLEVAGSVPTWRSEVSTEQRRNARAGETRDPRENQLHCPWPNLAIVAHIVARSPLHRPCANEVEKDVWSSDGIKGWGKREIPEKTRQQAASSGKIPTCENLLFAPHLGEQGSIPGGFDPGFSHVGIVSDDTFCCGLSREEQVTR